MKYGNMNSVKYRLQVAASVSVSGGTNALSNAAFMRAHVILKHFTALMLQNTFQNIRKSSGLHMINRF